ncbi:3-deoxy-D-arabinoheptulosonate-7-phosphate synthase [Tamilnaduibacter salinus]|uniref:3-deoxy-7-phosphoheptulonate synthase n=1 Tax=Tamilnaduibacter salinus TaxID=1484056 RepID=A0A2A2I717_9GAMM|nr:3-deoxy-7-phosphoheptulonate synthase [Tamilnaduibacter salinus]PAV27447.1 3-deoxy-7-phosphoheptulonate synthase [Tamilnaduibacter salinus]PVY75441.1 3-deoxy-D-arabinoheptulosonate-7-phosphate synthase [Tamilnaduibacter salinus]
MLAILHPDTPLDSHDYRQTMDFLENLPGVSVKVHEVQGRKQKLTEVYLLGDTKSLNQEEIEALPAVERVIRISDDYRILGRHRDDRRHTGFTYNGVPFDQDNLNVFAGLCAVDTERHVDAMMAALAAHGQHCTRMGAYKPRTNPYSFQGYGARSLPWVFEAAGRHDIRVVAMEVTHESHIEEIDTCLERLGRPTGVMLQVGTRNTQNFELLKAIGRQREYPVLLKRGFGITLNESLNAAEYLASEGNANVIFCLRGMKTELGHPHRNMVDFAHVPTVKRLTRMPVCIDPSHSVGNRDAAPDGIPELVHATAQGVVAGANMVLVDFHPHPEKALVDGPQALTLSELPRFLEDVRLCHDTWRQRQAIYSG